MIIIIGFIIIFTIMFLRNISKLSSYTADLSFGKLFTVIVVSYNFSKLRPEKLADPAHRVNCGQ